MPYKDLVKYFFLRNNHIACYKSEIEDSLRGFCEDGMFLGDWVSDSVALVKTYLSRNELKPNQYTEFYEIVISWIVQDMFVSRKGYSYNIEEFDQLPDSFLNQMNGMLFYSIEIILYGLILLKNVQSSSVNIQKNMKNVLKC